MEENITLKKLTLLLAMTMLLAACGGNSEPEKKGNVESAKDKNGDYATAEITVQGDDVVAINLDETKEGKSKKELGDKYGMKAASKKAKKEWDEQVEFLENYIEKNGLDKVEMNDAGYPVNDDVLAGCTINVKNLMDAAKNAKDNAK